MCRNMKNRFEKEDHTGLIVGYQLVWRRVWL
jgi:hypothetical protein